MTNTFLWDYYYSANQQQDANTDTYQTYYNTQRDLEQYPLLANGKPYIVGFPGATYYEFDLSGTFVPQHTAPTAPAKLDPQVVTFASSPAITVLVSDEELAAQAVANEGYTFMPNYLNQEIAADAGFLMNGEGNAFDKTTEATVLAPFRAYFVKGTPSSPAPPYNKTRTIVFDTDDSQFAIGDERDSKSGSMGDGTLTVSAHRHAISVTSSLRQPTDVRIVSASGVTIASFTIQPGETIDTDIPVAGVYIVRADNGRYTKKIAMK